ncbi:MAG: RsmB/NOP family class I SAM-dependent RNA methyltransferase, partial [Opitutales bacterium]
HVAPALRPGGRLVYAVCTLTRAETTAVAQQFSERHPEFEPTAVFPAASVATGASALVATSARAPASEPGPGSPTPAASLDAVSVSSVSRPPSSVFIWPHELNANGMFIAAWKRK